MNVWNDVLQPLNFLADVDHPVLLYGPPGTGKTRTAHEAARISGRPLFVDQCGEWVDERVLVNPTVQMTPKDPTAPIDPKTGKHKCLHDASVVFVKGIWRRAMEEGGILLLDEVNKLMGSDAWALLYKIGDDPDMRKIPCQTGEVIEPAKGFTLMATMNEDPQILDPAILSRFRYRIHVNVPSPQAIQALHPMARKFCEAAYQDEENRVVEYRELETFTKQVNAKQDPELVARCIWQDRGPSILAAMAHSADKKPKS